MSISSCANSESVTENGDSPDLKQPRDVSSNLHEETSSSLDQPPTKRKRQAKSSKSNDNVSVTRRLAQASRTLRACDLCRKQKTRCFRSPENPNACLRCQFVHKTCSFEVEAEVDAENGEIGTNVNSSTSSQKNREHKLDLILSGVYKLIRIAEKTNLETVDTDVHNSDTQLLLDVASSMQSEGGSGGGEEEETIVSIDDIDSSAPNFQSGSTTSITSPFSILKYATLTKPASYQPTPIMKLFTLSSQQQSQDNLVDLGILTEHEAIALMDDFRRNYGRWVSFPINLSTQILVLDLKQRSPLLLATCCCLTLRYISLNDEAAVWKFHQLSKILIRHLNQSLSMITCFSSSEYGFVEFLQSLVVLSIYSTSLSALVASIAKIKHDSELMEFNLDPWQISSVGITAFLTKSTFQLFRTSDGANEQTRQNNGSYGTLTLLRIYNHLCLVHIINSVFSGRMAVVDDSRVKYCSSVLSLFDATNFDGRMVAEIYILYSTYRYTQLGNNNSASRPSSLIESDFNDVLKEFHQWHQNWAYLLQQPALQFVELTYNFCLVLVNYVRLFQKVMIPHEAQKQLDLDPQLMTNTLIQSSAQELTKMCECAENVANHMNAIINDSYLAYLSDQVHFCCYFSGIFLINIVKVMDKKEALEMKRRKHKAVNTVKNLIRQFNKISINNGEDIFSKYAAGLRECLMEI
ncbi:hypothetical protein KGF56_002187 [Candida oxycetoniae]|uniref:Zn(2)-C6 fungal-type domain-containing protein n=1 Tax=Candida oxycetoniae TaxID=497107 RepID=A0AAI9SYD0_9ASCO|nr:uncharacterized protein KGF56_002187 [Candida oxycetoniae]KAI3405022.2 hypothetical protein KGF56_002187 [Candida oxycetoniae]